MRYMVIVKATKESEAGVMPTAQMLTDMGKFNAELAKAGIMLAGIAVPAAAQPGPAVTTVTKVHGPLKVLPHHNRKICKTRWVHHRRVKKCWYH